MLFVELITPLLLSRNSISSSRKGLPQLLKVFHKEVNCPSLQAKDFGQQKQLSTALWTKGSPSSDTGGTGSLFAEHVLKKLVPFLSLAAIFAYRGCQWLSSKTVPKCCILLKTLHRGHCDQSGEAGTCCTGRYLGGGVSP